jgi:hypothetical protein
VCVGDQLRQAHYERAGGPPRGLLGDRVSPGRSASASTRPARRCSTPRRGTSASPRPPWSASGSSSCSGPRRPGSTS